MCTSVCLHMYKCTTYVHGACRIPGGCEPPHRYWEANSSPLQEQALLVQSHLIILSSECSLVPFVVNCVCPYVCVSLSLCMSLCVWVFLA